MKWPTITAEILRSKGHDIKFLHKDWDGQATNVLVNDVTLPEYIEHNIKSMPQFLKNHYVLINRMFDNHVKAFIKNILMYDDVEYSTYRVEFQITSCAWSSLA